MTNGLQQLMDDWDGLAVVTRRDRSTDAWIFIAMHDDTLGSPVGGTRMKVYPHPAEGLRDAMRLAEGMTHKWAAIELDSGGGKAVISLSRPLDAAEREGLLGRYGELLNTLRGSFATGEDLGTTPQDMAVLSRTTRYVHGCESGRDVARDPGPFTALGVLCGMRAAVRHALGAEDLSGRRVLVQGVGDVGAPLARMCAEEQAVVLVSDLDAERTMRVAGELNAEVVEPRAVYSTPCDVYAPCAVGATLNAETIPRLGCRVVAGSANNQLKEPSDADRLHERGILYAPDYVVNAGGALAFGLYGRGHTNEELLTERVRGLGKIVDGILSEAARRDESPLYAARRHVDAVLEAAAEK